MKKYTFQIECTREQLNHFFWIAYAASLVLYTNAPGAGVVYPQIVEQLEDLLTENNPEKKETLKREVKDKIIESNPFLNGGMK